MSDMWTLLSNPTWSVWIRKKRSHITHLISS